MGTQPPHLLAHPLQVACLELRVRGAALRELPSSSHRTLAMSGPPVHLLHAYGEDEYKECIRVT
jgi:hypothetical protein